MSLITLLAPQLDMDTPQTYSAVEQAAAMIQQDSAVGKGLFVVCKRNHTRPTPHHELKQENVSVEIIPWR